jgi:tRNA splicing endonuclease
MKNKSLLIYFFIFLFLFFCSKNPVSISEKKGFRSLIYKEFGGIAGVNNIMNIDLNGAVSFKDRTDSTYTKKIEQEKIDEIVSAIYDNNFVSMKSQYGTTGAVADQLTLEVIYSDYYFTKSVIARTDPKDEPPQGFNTIVSILQKIQIDIKK